MLYKHQPELGSVLLWILVAVVLLAGLTSAMNQGSRTSSGMATDQQARLAATEIAQYGSSMKQAVNRLLLKGCSETELDFSNAAWKKINGDLWHEPGENPNAPDTGCSIFAAADGGMQAIIFPKNFTNTSLGSDKLTATATVPGHSRATRSAIPGVGDEDSEDLLLSLFWLDKKICQSLNELLGVSSANDDIPSYTGSVPPYAGTFQKTAKITDPSGRLTGKQAACGSTDEGNYFFWQVLIQR